MSAYRYLLTCLSSVLLLGLVVTGFNWFVDPFGYFARNPFGFYHVAEERLFKARMISSQPYDSVILGSSRTDIIDPGGTAKWKLKTFNASFLGGYPEEILYFIENFLPDVKIVFLGFDFYMFNALCRGPISSDFGSYSLRNLMTYSFSYDTTYHSFQTLKKNLKGRPPLYWPAGNRNMEEKEAANAKAEKRDYQTLIKNLKNTFTCKNQFSPRRLKVAKKLVRELRRRVPDVVVFMNPVNVLMNDYLREWGFWADFQDWKVKMNSAFPNIVDLSSEPFSGPENFYWNDPVHYTKATGEKILEVLVKGRI